MAKKKIETEDILEKYDISHEQEMFCQYFTAPTEFYGNGIQSYAAAYNKDLSDKKDYNTSKACAWALLQNPKIIRRINSLIDNAGFNDMNADKQLLFLMNQHSDFTNKLGAIKEYNKLKNRITDRLELHADAPISYIEIIPYVPPQIDAPAETKEE